MHKETFKCNDFSGKTQVTPLSFREAEKQELLRNMSVLKPS